MFYTKPALTFDQQLDLLIERGLQIVDRQRALRWLQHVNYYRLSAYFRSFKEGERFRRDIVFDDIAGLYIFDRRLRLILLDAIERIEVAFRTAITYELVHKDGPFGYLEATNFARQLNHAAFLADLEHEVANSKETFVHHFQSKYSDETHLPLWMASELISFGQLSRLYRAAPPAIKTRIARRVNANDTQVASWLHSLSYVRNLCAHHSRLWNRELAIKPSLPYRSSHWPYELLGNERLYCVLVIVRHCLLLIAPGCRWAIRLFELFDQHPKVRLIDMQIPDDWRDREPWKSSAAN